MEDRAIKCKKCSKDLQVRPEAEIVSCSSCKINYSITSNKQLSREQGIQHLVKSMISRAKTMLPGAGTSQSKSMNCESSPAGRSSSKRALLCGVSYENSKYNLKGPVNDVKNMRDLLINKFGFQKPWIRVLTEEEPGQKYAPTKANIMDSLNWLVGDCQPEDSLVFFFSGHGLRQPNFNGQEIDGFDETICPVDFEEKGMILDNELYSKIVKPLKTGTKLHAIVDACHSGSILDLPYVFNRTGKTWEDSEPNPNSVEGLAICISACRDNELASDTSAFTGTMNGALTYSFIEVVKKNIKSGVAISYEDLLEQMDELIDDANAQGCGPYARKGGCVANTRLKIMRTLFQGRLISKPLLSSSEKFEVQTKHFEL